MKSVTTNTELANFRDKFPECSVVVLADLSTGMVLAFETEDKLAHETLDKLCRNAMLALAGPTANDVGDVFGRNKIPSKFISLTSNQKECFIRAAPPAQEALCLVLTSSQEMAPMMVHATEVLHNLVGDA